MLPSGSVKFTGEGCNCAGCGEEILPGGSDSDVNVFWCPECRAIELAKENGRNNMLIEKVESYYDPCHRKESYVRNQT